MCHGIPNGRRDSSPPPLRAGGTYASVAGSCIDGSSARQRWRRRSKTAFDSPELVSFKGLDGPIRADGSQRVERVGEGSRASFEMEMRGHGFGVLMLPMARRQATRQVAESHENLKRILETAG